MKVRLSYGSGGREMESFITKIKAGLYIGNKWQGSDDDAAHLTIADKKVFFTTDSYIVDPIFFKGGDIGKIAFCGTVNDLLVQGAEEVALSLSLILEEGFEEFDKVLDTLKKLSNTYEVPIVTGDTKVITKGSVDKIVINTSGIGFGTQVLDSKVLPGDKVVVSGGIGEHAAALLAKRFEMENETGSDCKALTEEFKAVRSLIKQAKDITRGGVSSVVNEIAKRNGVGIRLYEEKVPVKDSVRALVDVLGLDIYSLACEGRFVCVTNMPNQVVKALRRFDAQANVVGEVIEGSEVLLKTRYGERLLTVPSGDIVPRIC